MASAADSSNRSRMSRIRLAPIDERIAISPARVAPRTSMRLATLKQTIRSTRPATPSSIANTGPVSVRTIL